MRYRTCWVLVGCSALFCVVTCREHSARGGSQSCSPPASPPAPTVPAERGVSAVWANDGGDKVTRDELRVADHGAGAVINGVWNGAAVRVFGARNEVVSFNVVLEAVSGASGVQVSQSALSGPDQYTIDSVPAGADRLFDWHQRNVELFYIRYLPIKGLSRLAYDMYDERHVPRRFRRPFDSGGQGRGTWNDRPDHDKLYPDIAVPLELHPSFDIPPRSNQSVWVDIYVPKGAPPGEYSGQLTVAIAGGGAVTQHVPVRLIVHDLTLPDVSRAKVFLYMSAQNVDHRYVGERSPEAEAKRLTSRLVRDRHFMLAHRHRIDLIGDRPSVEDRPHPDWLPRLDGSLFTAVNGYAGPGEELPNSVYSVGTYGTWSWRGQDEAAMWQHTDAWVSWLDTHAPGVDYFLYLIDESRDFAQIEQWAQWIDNNPGPGRRMRAMATLRAPDARAEAPSLDVVASCDSVASARQWQPAVAALQNSADADKKFYYYNGGRPGCGSHAIEDDGVALRQKAWAQYKLKIERWFLWESTYYNNFQGQQGETNVFERAQTFGSLEGRDPVRGETGWNYTNGDGVFFYPGTDHVYPESSYDVLGPFASLRLKHWRRGIQDVEYLLLAEQKDPERVAAIVSSLVPKVLWEYGVGSEDDPSWVRTDISWPADPDVWEAARRELANIAEGSAVETPASGAKGGPAARTARTGDSSRGASSGGR